MVERKSIGIWCYKKEDGITWKTKCHNFEQLNGKIVPLVSFAKILVFFYPL